MGGREEPRGIHIRGNGIWCVKSFKGGMTLAEVSAQWAAVQARFADHVPRAPAVKAFFQEAYRPQRRRSVKASEASKASKAYEATVEKADTLEVALRLRGEGHDPLVLILADAYEPGGCVRAGAGMQEESLFRRTALFKHLDKTMPGLYPIEPLAAVYAPSVPVVVDGRHDVELAFVACPGLKMPQLDRRERLMPDDVALLRKKVALILQVAHDLGHASVVLGALGCGAFGCPSRDVAEVFRDVLATDFADVFDRVAFAVLGANHDLFKSSITPLPLGGG